MAFLSAFKTPLTAEFKDLLLELHHLGFEDLTDWEVEFVESLQERIEKYGNDTIISSGQWEQIDRICAKYNLR